MLNKCRYIASVLNNFRVHIPAMMIGTVANDDDFDAKVILEAQEKDVAARDN